jgi:hypothetical protein
MKLTAADKRKNVSIKVTATFTLTGTLEEMLESHDLDPSDYDDIDSLQQAIVEEVEYAPENIYDEATDSDWELQEVKAGDEVVYP